MDGSRYPRPGHRIAPLALREILQAPIPDKRFSRKLRLSDLDETTWDRYDVATCRKLAEAVVRQISPVLPLLMNQRHLPKLPSWVTADDILLEPRTYNCLHRRGWLKNPQGLADLTIRELLLLPSFGKKCLVDLLTSLESFISWPAHSQPVVQLDGSITIEAKKLLRMKYVELCTDDDPRFGRLVLETGLEAKSVKDLAEKLIGRSSDPSNPQALIRRLIDLQRQLQRASHLTLDSELNEFTAALGDHRDRQMIVERLGWNGNLPKTLETIGKEFNMTRERVRQICSRVERLSAKKPFAPVLDRAIQAMRAEVPAKAEKVEKQLVAMRLTRTAFRLESLLQAAEALGRTLNVTVETVYKTRFILPGDLAGSLETVAQSARASVRHWGVATVEDVAAETSQSAAWFVRFWVP